MGKAQHAIELAKTVIEIAEVAWSAAERFHHHKHDDHDESFSGSSNCCLSPEELEMIRTENRRFRELLEQNLKLLQNLSDSPCLSADCPPDLHQRLVAEVDSGKFLSRLQSLHGASVNGLSNGFPFEKPTGGSAVTLIKS